MHLFFIYCTLPGINRWTGGLEFHLFSSRHYGQINTNTAIASTPNGFFASRTQNWGTVEQGEPMVVLEEGGQQMMRESTHRRPRTHLRVCAVYMAGSHTTLSRTTTIPARTRASIGLNLSNRTIVEKDKYRNTESISQNLLALNHCCVKMTTAMKLQYQFDNGTVCSHWRSIEFDSNYRLFAISSSNHWRFFFCCVNILKRKIDAKYPTG